MSAPVSTSSQQSASRFILPTSIEGATRRYVKAYKDHFDGPGAERTRLVSAFEERIDRLRRKAPKFYETKLPKLINQAASALLACDLTRLNGINAFNETHKNILSIFDELCRSQPKGDVDFQSEKDRLKQRDKYMYEQITLRNQLFELESRDFDLEEIGEDESTSAYNKTFEEITRVKKRLKIVSLRIAAMEGEKFEEEIKFELKIPPGSVLKKLTDGQVRRFKLEVLDFLKANQTKKSVCLYVDLGVIEEILKKIGIDKETQKSDFNDFLKDSLDAVKAYFRDLEQEERNERLDGLLKTKHFIPKEGLIIKDPDDVPEDVRLKLESSERACRRQLEEYEERLRNTPWEENDDKVDILEDSNESEVDEDDLQKVLEEHEMFRRVKEEPRDDYDNGAPSDDELIVDKRPATDEEYEQSKKFKAHGGDDCIIISDEEDDDDTIATPQDGNEDDTIATSRDGNGDDGSSGDEESKLVPSFTDAQIKVNQLFGLKEDSISDYEETSPSEDIVVLGTIAPKDKIDVIDLE